VNKFAFMTGFVFFTVAVSCGYLLGANSWNGAIYLADGSLVSNTNRNPAAIKRELDFSHLNGAELITATQKRLVSAARVIIREGLAGVELGHFVARDETGQRRLACDALYNRLTLRFEGNGMATDGDKARMEVDGPCVTSTQDISRIEPIWIPVSKILKTPATNEELDFSEGVKFKFTDMNGDWPTSWSLESVRLYNSEDTGRTIDISARDLHEIRQHPFVLNWLEAQKASRQ